MKFILILSILNLCFIFSCQKAPESTSPEFALVESVMWDHPDSALVLLKKMPKPVSSDKLNHATWCLLYTQARDKNYIKHTSDSLINIAVAYFDAGKDWRRKSQAWFYKGQVLRDMGEDEEAVACYVKAKDILANFEDPQFASLVCRTLGNLYRYQKLYDLSIRELREGLNYTLQLPQSKSLSHAFSELGRTFAEFAEWDSARYYFEHSLENARMIKDSRTETMAIEELSVVFRSTGDYEKALGYQKEALFMHLQQGYIRNLAQTKYGIGGAFYSMGELDSAKVYYKESIQTSNVYTIRGAYKRLYLIAKKEGKYQDAINYYEHYQVYNDSIVNIDKTKAIAEVQVKYNNEKLENERKSLLLEKDKLQRYSLLGGMFFIIIIGGIAFVYQRKLLLKERHIRKAHEDIQAYLSKLQDNEQAIQENQELIQTISNELKEKEGLKGLVDEQSVQINHLQDKIKYLQSQNQDYQQKIEKSLNTVRNYDKSIFSMENLIQQNTSLKTRESFLIDYINNHVNLFRELRENSRKTYDWPLIIENVDILYNRFYQRLKEKFPILNKEQLRVCYLIKIGLSTSQIADIMGISPSSVTKKKYRIREKMNRQIGNLITENISLDMFLKMF